MIHFGHISKQQFLEEYWQKKPLLIKINYLMLSILTNIQLKILLIDLSVEEN
jgi:ribosomal protein L16 Arg81 hydroxylase